MGPATKLGLLASLYFAQGLPFGFFTQALPVLMRRHGLSLPEIGLAHLLALPWALKFLWAPLVDRHQLLPGAGLGRRRSWILPLQLLAVAAVAALALVEPGRGLGPVLAAVLLCNLLAATQDIATDGLAVDLLSEGERGLGNGVQVAGYRVGMIAGGGLLLILFDRLGWAGAFLAMAAMLLLSTVPVGFLREEAAPAGNLPDRGGGLQTGAAVRQFLRRPGALPWLLVLFLYKSGEALATGMLRTFLVDRGLGMEDIGWLLGTVGFSTGLLGAVLGGALVGPLGRRRALLLFGVVQTFAVAGYALSAYYPPTTPGLYGLCAVEHLASGLATAALFTAMMDVSRPESGATDYTVQACAVVIATGGAAALSGFSAQALGYGAHFLLAAALCAIGTVAAAQLGSAWEALRRARG